ncbi:hypothetical protein HZU67_05448 [Apis mellifera carnica]|nr:hypothetical protein HZU67_05448 [Apis mellifera carnica]
MQEKLLYIRLLQRMLRRIVITRRSRKDPNMDQATSWSGTRGLGKIALVRNILQAVFKHCCLKMKRKNFTKWSST